MIDGASWSQAWRQLGASALLPVITARTQPEAEEEPQDSPDGSTDPAETPLP